MFRILSVGFGAQLSTQRVYSCIAPFFFSEKLIEVEKDMLGVTLVAQRK